MLVLLLSAALTAQAQWADTLRPLPSFAPARAPATAFSAARYRGTVGKQRVTVTLSVEDDPNATKVLTGTVRFDGQPATLHRLRSRHAYRAAAPVQVAEADSALPAVTIGYWEAEQPAGPFLTGTWTGLAGEKQPFELREDYRDQWGRLAAVPYEIVTKEYVVVADSIWNAPAFTARMKQGSLPDSLTPLGICRQEHLHLLGADTLRKTVANMQCPPPARRGEWAWQQAIEKRKRLTEGKRQGNSNDYRSTEEETRSIGVLYADNGLLC